MGGQNEPRGQARRVLQRAAPNHEGFYQSSDPRPCNGAMDGGQNGGGVGRCAAVGGMKFVHIMFLQ